MSIQINKYTWTRDPNPITDSNFIAEGNAYAAISIMRDPETMKWRATMITDHPPTRLDPGHESHDEIDIDFMCFDSAESFAVAQDLKELAAQLEYESRITEDFLKLEYQETAQ